MSPLTLFDMLGVKKEGFPPTETWFYFTYTVSAPLLLVSADEEELRMCPDCPRLQDLTNVEGLQRIGGVIRKYNVLNATEHYFVLSDVGRMSASVNTNTNACNTHGVHFLF